MTEIKRPNYFTSQLLVEADFNREQAYHLLSRRLHNRLLHTFGVADANGFAIAAVTGAQPPKVTIQPGTAIDKDGNEIVLGDVKTYQLGNTTPNTDVFLTVKYQDALDDSDKYPPATEHFTRTTERPLFQDFSATTPPPTDGSVIVLARIHLALVSGSSQIQSIDTTVRTLSSAKLGPGVVTGTVAGTSTSTGNIALGTITGGNTPAGSVSGGNIAAGTITGGATPSGTAGTGNIAPKTITGGNTPAGTVGSGNIAAGTVTGGSTVNGNVASPAGNIAIGTVTGGANSNGATGNIAVGTIIGGTNTTGSPAVATGNIAVGTITGGASGGVATGNIAFATITGANIVNNSIGAGQIANNNIGANQLVANCVGAGQLAQITTGVTLSGTGTVPAATGTPPVFGVTEFTVVNDVGAGTGHAVLLFSLNCTTNGPVHWFEKSSFSANAKVRKIVVTNDNPAASNFEWKAIVLPL